MGGTTSRSNRYGAVVDAGVGFEFNYNLPGEVRDGVAQDGAQSDNGFLRTTFLAGFTVSYNADSPCSPGEYLKGNRCHPCPDGYDCNGKEGKLCPFGHRCESRPGRHSEVKKCGYGMIEHQY